MTTTRTAEAAETTKPAVNKVQVVALKPPRLPYHEAVQERFGIDRAGWKALVEAIYPNAETADAIVMALSYCRARNLDPFKRPVHIVPMWSSAAGKMIETVWPGISELRTTAFRTGQYAGTSGPKFGPTREMTFSGTATRGRNKGQERSITLKFPEWCRLTITRDLNGKERTFVGPKVHWLEAYAKWADTEVPNDMWANRSVGQLEKCAEAGALRRAFPEEIGNDLTAEEMAGQRITDGAPVTPEKPKPESVTPPSAGGERKPLPPLVSQPQSPTAAVPADELSKQFAVPSQEDPEIPHAPAHAAE
jgi:phage recombination protein Bet